MTRTYKLTIPTPCEREAAGIKVWSRTNVSRQVKYQGKTKVIIWTYPKEKN